MPNVPPPIACDAIGGTAVRVVELSILGSPSARRNRSHAATIGLWIPRGRGVVLFNGSRSSTDQSWFCTLYPPPPSTSAACQETFFRPRAAPARPLSPNRLRVIDCVSTRNNSAPPVCACFSKVSATTNGNVFPTCNELSALCRGTSGACRLH